MFWTSSRLQGNSMDKRTFLFSLGGLAAALALGGGGVSRALAAQLSGSNQERILRITRSNAMRLQLLSVKDVESAVRLKKGRNFLLSLQSRAEYQAGHVPGSVLFPQEELADRDKLAAMLGKLPKDKSIVLICPNGHLSSAIMLFLRQLGFDATAMAFGMDGWNRAYAGSGAYPGDIGGPISHEPFRLQSAGTAAPPEFSSLDDEALVVSASHGKYLAEIPPLAARDTLEDYTVICLRRPEDYAAGHIPGSVNIPSEAFYGGDRIILQIPRGKKVLLSCYVGHYSSGAALLLAQLGYESYSLAWGMAGWNKDFIGPLLQTLSQSANLPVEKGGGAELLSS